MDSNKKLKTACKQQNAHCWGLGMHRVLYYYGYSHVIFKYKMYNCDSLKLNSSHRVLSQIHVCTLVRFKIFYLKCDQINSIHKYNHL